MSNWTPEQQLAIDLEGKNIIVSAGAGSGKTAVLTERVLRKLKSGVHINELLVLTFTNAAAKEMKDRIRTAISENSNLADEGNLIDSAYITTFDSFSLSLVKKYAYTQNITSNISITDEVLVDIEKKKLIDEIFEEQYNLKNIKFLKLINDFCLKDDQELKDLIIGIYKKLELNYDIDTILNTYIEKFYDQNKINKDLEVFIKEIKLKINNIKEILVEMNEYFDGEYISKVEDAFSNLFNATTYDEIINNLDVTIPRIPKGTSEEGKKLKEQIPDMKRQIEKLCIYSNSEEIINNILSTKDNTSVIVELLKYFHKKITIYKTNNEVYTFNDISRLAIKLVKENTTIRDELKTTFNEIMVDEYQDTNDIQETFISLISNNNIYMVGDIKQSIYRFRNANPYIFKNKYDTYRDTDQGEKIDLNKNFRSRAEVLDNINELFNLFMDDEFGGADYKTSHEMVFGNTSYIEEGKTNQNYNLEILTYEEKNNSKCTPLEKEIFIIGNDIKQKMNSKFQVFDKGPKILRDIKYSDFVILLDKSTTFDTYKKIFEYLNIPLNILKDSSVTNNYDISIIKNLLKLIILIKNKDYKEEFKYNFISVSRSFLINKSDQDIYNIFTNNTYFETDLYKKCLELSFLIDNTPILEFFCLVLETFNYEERLLSINDLNTNLIREEYFYNLINNMSTSYTIYDFVEYLEQVFENKYDIRFSLGNDTSDSVKIMTIHKSKGLEFPICYFAGFSSEFNYMELRQKIIYDRDLGIILPSINEQIKPTIYKIILKLRTRREEISEKIRLLYVALTRAKEQLIIVIPELQEEQEVNKIVPNYIREKYNSFISIIKSIYNNIYRFRKLIDTNNCNKNYIYENKNNTNEDLILDQDNLVVEEITINKELIEEKRYSKDKIHLVTKSEKELMEFGSVVHEVLEQIDFNNPDTSKFNINEDIKNKIELFLNSDILTNNLNSKFYKEYEFITTVDNKKTHGIIDLMIENEKEILIIDYKLKNIEDKAYVKQLTGYKDYIKSITNKNIKCYLYSIIDNLYKEI